MADQSIPVVDGNKMIQQAGISNAKTNPATKVFAVNATGNLFVASTLNGGEDGNTELTEAAQKAFSQVSVFFAAMTKAIASQNKSLYDYDAINKVITNSGMFVQIGEMDYTFKTSSWGLELSGELVKVMMAGFTGNMAAIGKAISPLMNSMGSEGIKISRDKSSQSSKVAALIFVCEYLLGAVSITPILVVADMQKMSSTIKASPCFTQTSSKLTYELKKYQYMFVPPEFMNEAVAINEAMANPDFQDLVKELVSSIEEDSDTNSGSTAKTDTTPKKG